MQPGSFLYTRRELLFGLGGAALALSAVRNGMYNPHLAAHTSIWMEEAEFRNLGPASILDEALAGTARAGYSRVELVSEFLDAALRDRTFALLEKYKLEPSIVFTADALYQKEIAEASRQRVKELAWFMMGRGTAFVNFSPAAKPDEQPKTVEELETESYQLNRMADDLRPAGIELMVHHHEAEMRDNAREWRYWLAHTEPKLVSYCLDVDWVSRAGVSPLSLLDTAGPRVRSLHLRNPKKGVDQELLGPGDIDMPRIARLLRQMSFDGFLVVELQHNAATPRQRSLPTDLSTSRFYMQEIFGSRQGNPPVDMGPYVRKKVS